MYPETINSTLILIYALSHVPLTTDRRSMEYKFWSKNEVLGNRKSTEYEHYNIIVLA